MAILVCGTLEYLTSYFMEKFIMQDGGTIAKENLI